MYGEEEDGSKSLETLNNAQGNDLALHNNLPFCLLCFSWLPPNDSLLPPPTSFVFKVIVPFGGVTQFSWVSPMYTGGIHVIKLVFAFLLLTCFYYQNVSTKNLKKKK